jgi:deazaflavin-dependent oxidoreductase (nitroreductase family)
MLKQVIRDRVRVLNKYILNKIFIHIADKKFDHFAILSHKGRKSGKIYKIPLIAEPVEDGFVMALTYGRKVDWCANVLANGGCDLRWREKEYKLTDPVFIDKESGMKAFPVFLSRMLRRAEIENFLHLSIMKEN